MKLSEMKQLLAERRIQLTKSLGQNFLHDANQLKRIVEGAELTEDDDVLEIGPGLGPLTELLLKKAHKVLAIEKDRRLFELLSERFKAQSRLNLVHGDALRLVADDHYSWEKWKMVSNLPYSVASPILVELAGGRSCPRRIVATLQIEVARRVMAQAGSADYGVLTLLVQLRYRADQWFKIPAGCFFPEPEVDSACVILVRRDLPLLAKDQTVVFERIVKRAFSQRRKMMLKLLKADWPADQLERAFQRLQIPFQTRAEKVNLELFVELTKLIAS